MSSKIEAPEALTYSVSTAARLLGVSDWSLRQAVERGEVHAIRVGHRILIPKLSLNRLLAEKDYIPDTDDDNG